MINAPQYALVSVMHAIPFGKDLFGLELDEHYVYRNCNRPLKNGAGLRKGVYLLRASISADGSVKLPCPVESIRSVTQPQPVSYYGGCVQESESLHALLNTSLGITGATRALPQFNQFPDPDSISGAPALLPRKDKAIVLDKSEPLTTIPTGRYLNYQYDSEKTVRIDPLLPLDSVDIVYRSLLTDCDGYPMTTEKCAEAASYYFNFLHQQFLYYQRKSTEPMMDKAWAGYERTVAQSRTPDSLGNNEINALMQVMTSHQRALFGDSYSSPLA